MKIFLLFFIGVILNGCSSELKVQIKAAEAEREQPSTSLVRRVDVSYRDEKGQEKLRESAAVIGMSQPVSIHSDSVEGLEWDEKGVWEARAYAGDGLLLLRGVAQANPDDEETVEIVMSREASQSSQLASTLLRKIRLKNSSQKSDLVIDASELRKGSCVDLPKVILAPEAETLPSLVFESVIKAPQLRFEINGSSQAISINGAGDAELLLGKNLGDQQLFAQSAQLSLKIFSQEYEGCLSLSIEVPPPVVKPIVLSTIVGPGATQRADLSHMKPTGILQMTNPNSFPVNIHVYGGMIWPQVTNPRIFHEFVLLEDTDDGHTRDSSLIDQGWLNVEPGQSRVVVVYNVCPSGRCYCDSICDLKPVASHGYKIEYRVVATAHDQIITSQTVLFVP